jgi:hypothetical protein
MQPACEHAGVQVLHVSWLSRVTQRDGFKMFWNPGLPPQFAFDPDAEGIGGVGFPESSRMAEGLTVVYAEPVPGHFRTWLGVFRRGPTAVQPAGCCWRPRRRPGMWAPNALCTKFWTRPVPPRRVSSGPRHTPGCWSSGSGDREVFARGPAVSPKKCSNDFRADDHYPPGDAPCPVIQGRDGRNLVTAATVAAIGPDVTGSHSPRRRDD